MMRKKLQKMAVIAALLPLALALAMTMVSCPTEDDGGGGGGGGSAGLSGKWINQSGSSSPYTIVVLEFISNKLIISDTDETTVATYFYTDTDGEIKIGTSSSSINDTFCESYDITAGVLTFTGGTSEDDYPSANFYRVNTISANQWKDGTITSDSKGEVWYSFNVTADTTYNLWWNDYDGNKTLDIRVSSYYSSGASVFNNIDGGWGTAQSFTPAEDSTVYVKVTPYPSGRTPTGTFALIYSSTATTRPSAPFNPPSSTALTANQWKDGEVTAALNGTVWYSFSVTAGTAYNVWWNESGANGNNTKTLNVSVRGYYSDGETIFSATTDAWGTAKTFTPTASGTVYLRVTAGTGGQTGTFGIVYNTGTPAERPSLVFNPPNVTPLTADEWKDGEITTSSGYVWYSLTVTANTPYYFWWNESGDNGNSSKSLNVSVSALNSDGTVIADFSNVATAWATAKSYTPTADGTVYLRVAPATSGQTGTYGIVYSTTNTRLVASFTPPSATALTTDVWANGELTSTIREVWYSFTATSGTAYSVWWNDSYQGNSTKTVDVYVKGFYSDGTTAFGGAAGADSGWTTAQSFTPTADGTVYLRVTLYSSTSTANGTFGIVYSDNATTRPLIPTALPSTATPLTAGVWTDGSLTSSVREVWYSFTVASGTTYRLWWNESDIYGDGSKTLNVTAGAWYSDGTTIFEGVNAAWTSATQSTITPTANGTVYVRITPYSSTSSAGTFAITYNADSATMPPVSINPVSPTALTVDEWEDGEITAAGGELWYSIAVTSGTSYRIWLNESGSSGNGTKTLDITARVFYSNGTTSLNTIGSAWSSGSTTFTPTANDTVYIKITATNSSNTGTFGVAYSTTSTRPTLVIELPTNATALTAAGTWVNGNIPTAGGQQWFTFTATATTQYIHIAFGTLNDMWVQVYDSNGAVVGNNTNIFGSTRYISRPVTASQTYYIKVRPYGSGTSGVSGDYKIAFNTSSTAPALP